MILHDEKARRILIEAFCGSMEEHEKSNERFQEFLLKRKIEEERERRAELKRKRLAKQGFVQQKIDKFEDDE